MITFRGSVTSKDWLVDGKFFLTDVPNPILQNQSSNKTNGKTKSHESFSIPQSKYIGVHIGFYEYLFLTRSKENGTNKYTQILTSLQTLLQRDDEIRSYTINVTGHSLGGALATLFTFYLVLEKELIVQPQLPIFCINFASPKCGNIQFARAFQELELRKKIICLRVANYRDLITERPDRLTCWTFCCQNAIFRHVGIELQLYPEPSERKKQQQLKEQHKQQQHKQQHKQHHNMTNIDKRYRIRYPRVRRSRLSQFSDDFMMSLFNTIHCTASVTCGCCINDYMKWHSCDEYLSRIENVEQALQSLPMQSIHDLYRNIVSEDSEQFTLPVLVSKSQLDVNK
jgi:Lipase (class 3)